MNSRAAIVVAGGHASRLGGRLKPIIEVGGARMIDRVIAALDGHTPVIVVGPEELAVRAGTVRVRENPPGGGPVAAIGAAFGFDDDTARAPEPEPTAAPEPAFAAVVTAVTTAEIVTIVAGDLPLLTTSAIELLHRAIGADGPDGALYVDESGRWQWLCGAWRSQAVARRLAELVGERGSLTGCSLKALFGPLAFHEIRADREDSADRDLPPFTDCDTEEDIRRVEEWLSR